MKKKYVYRRRVLTKPAIAPKQIAYVVKTTPTTTTTLNKNHESRRFGRGYNELLISNNMISLEATKID